MKKTFFLFLILIFIFGALSLFSPNLVSASDSVAAGRLIKGTTNPTIYYLAEDGKRYVFPSANIFFSWFDDFKNVTVVSDETLASYPLGGNVKYRPGIVLVKIQTDPKVYLVTNNGTLRWVKSEALAKTLYGNDWNKLVDDLPDSFFTDYKVGQAITGENEVNLTDLEDEYPSISHNFGFKSKVKVMSSLLKPTEKKCGQLEKAVNTLQKRLARWKMSLGAIGSDFVSECVQKNILTPKANKGKDKVTLCHLAADSRKKTITVGAAAVKAHLAHGDSLGECLGSDNKDKTAPVISAVGSTAGCVSATISWTTNEAATSKAYYATDTLASSTAITTVVSSSLVTAHALELTGLATSSKYYFKVESKDAAGNTASSSEASFTTLAACADATAPVISAVGSTASSTYATITWTTDELATSKVYYSLTALATSSAITTLENINLVTAHALELTGLATSSKYYFKVESKDAAGNTASSSEASFITTSLVE